MAGNPHTKPNANARTRVLVFLAVSYKWRSRLARFELGREIPHQVPVLGTARLLHGRRRAFPSEGGRLRIGEIGTQGPKLVIGPGELLEVCPRSGKRAMATSSPRP